MFTSEEKTREIKRIKAEEIDRMLERFAPALNRIQIEDAVAGIREDRERR